jgi:hypothetical protein
VNNAQNINALKSILAETQASIAMGDEFDLERYLGGIINSFQAIVLIRETLFPTNEQLDAIYATKGGHDLIESWAELMNDTSESMRGVWYTVENNAQAWMAASKMGAEVRKELGLSDFQTKDAYLLLASMRELHSAATYFMQNGNFDGYDSARTFAEWYSILTIGVNAPNPYIYATLKSKSGLSGVDGLGVFFVGSVALATVISVGVLAAIASGGVIYLWALSTKEKGLTKRREISSEEAIEIVLAEVEIARLANERQEKEAELLKGGFITSEQYSDNVDKSQETAAFQAALLSQFGIERSKASVAIEKAIQDPGDSASKKGAFESVADVAMWGAIGLVSLGALVGGTKLIGLLRARRG